jgi:hypothetical protein
MNCYEKMQLYDMLKYSNTYMQDFEKIVRSCLNHQPKEEIF